MKVVVLGLLSLLIMPGWMRHAWSVDRALVIGVEHYGQESIPTVAGVLNDAETWAKNLADGATRLPNVPLAYGFRDGAKFWFAEHRKPFWFPTPTDKGPKEESVLYEANRLDPDNVQFTREACKQLTGIPKPFLKTALKGIIKRAKEDGVELVDVDYVKKLNDERSN